MRTPYHGLALRIFRRWPRVPVSQATLDLWASDIADFPLEVAQWAVERVCRGSRTFPTVAEIRELAAWRARQLRELAPQRALPERPATRDEVKVIITNMANQMRWGENWRDRDAQKLEAVRDKARRDLREYEDQQRRARAGGAPAAQGAGGPAA